MRLPRVHRSGGETQTSCRNAFRRCRSDLRLVGQVPTVFAQTGRGGECDEPFGLRPVVAYGRHRQDEPASAQADRLDQHRAARPGQDNHVTGIDIASKDHVLHK